MSDLNSDSHLKDILLGQTLEAVKPRVEHAI
jgi:hypothetical protein